MAEAKEKKLGTSKEKLVKDEKTEKLITNSELLVANQEVKDGDIQENNQVTNGPAAQEQEVDSTSSLQVDQKPETSDKGLETKVAKPLAKAGKKSAKALKEAEAKEAKEERKAHTDETPAAEAKKTVKPKARTRLERAGKKFREVAKLIEADKQYTAKEALDLATKTSPVKFDATVELHVRLGVDPRQADQNVRDNLILPAGTGKTVRIAVLAEADDAAAAKKAGANLAGNDDLLKEIEKGVINFDTLIATPQMMAKLGKYARVLGPKGLMPNPKSGTVTPDVVKAVEQAKAGRVEYRVDSTGIVHLGIGKVSFGTDKLEQNIQAVFASIKSNKPTSIKGLYVKGITISTTMGPGIKVAISEL
jgi:large subunit ribosomal protein L1